MGGVERMVSRIPVYKIDVETDAIVEEYDSICQAAKENNTTPAAISRVTNGYRRQHLGFRWEKQEDPVVKKYKLKRFHKCTPRTKKWN